MLASEGLLHEQEFVRSFIQRERRERVSQLLSDRNRRKKFTNALGHLNWPLDERFATQIPSNLAHTAAEVASLLRSKGAGPTVWVISEDSRMDARCLPLDEALHSIWGGSMGTILSCIPGKLAVFRGEEMKSEYLLQHP